jgi:hypothetical protein
MLLCVADAVEAPKRRKRRSSSHRPLLDITLVVTTMTAGGVLPSLCLLLPHWQMMLLLLQEDNWGFDLRPYWWRLAVAVVGERSHLRNFFPRETHPLHYRRRHH